MHTVEHSVGAVAVALVTWSQVRAAKDLCAELGQIPLSSQSSSTLQATVPTLAQPFATSAQQSAENVAKAVGQTTLPTFDLIRVGFLF